MADQCTCVGGQQVMTWPNAYQEVGTETGLNTLSIDITCLACGAMRQRVIWRDQGVTHSVEVDWTADEVAGWVVA